MGYVDLKGNGDKLLLGARHPPYIRIKTTDLALILRFIYCPPLKVYHAHFQ